MTKERSKKQVYEKEKAKIGQVRREKILGL